MDGEEFEKKDGQWKKKWMEKVFQIRIEKMIDKKGDEEKGLRMCGMENCSWK